MEVAKEAKLSYKSQHTHVIYCVPGLDLTPLTCTTTLGENVLLVPIFEMREPKPRLVKERIHSFMPHLYGLALVSEVWLLSLSYSPLHHSALLPKENSFI